jgi:hypothetical protein
VARTRAEADPDTWGPLTVKRYTSEKIPVTDSHWRHVKIVLSPINREFDPIKSGPDDARNVRVLAHLLTVLHGADRG